MILKTVDGVEANVVQELEVQGKKFFLVDLGTSRYLNGVLTRYLVCPIQQFARSDVIPDKVEIV